MLVGLFLGKLLQLLFSVCISLCDTLVLLQSDRWLDHLFQFALKFALKYTMIHYCLFFPSCDLVTSDPRCAFPLPLCLSNNLWLWIYSTKRSTFWILYMREVVWPLIFILLQLELQFQHAATNTGLPSFFIAKLYPITYNNIVCWCTCQVIHN